MKRCDPGDDDDDHGGGAEDERPGWRQDEPRATFARMNPSRRRENDDDDDDDNPSDAHWRSAALARDNLPALVSGGCRPSTGETTIRDGDGDNQADLGQFVLTVDFAPPAAGAFIVQQQQRKCAPSSTPTGEPLNVGGGGGGGSSALAISPQQQQFGAANTNSHLIEVSVCIRSKSGQQRRLDDDSPDCQDQVNYDDQQQQQQQRRQQREPEGRPKRRLVFERLDRIVLEMDNAAGGDETGSGANQGDFQANVRLPLKSGLFDACLCFNLLNIRVASSRLLMLEQLFELDQNQCCLEEEGSEQQQQQHQRLAEETRQELERDWLRMERLTTELRTALLAELARVVHKNGKIMVSVFAYECCANGGGGGGPADVDAANTYRGDYAADDDGGANRGKMSGPVRRPQSDTSAERHRRGRRAHKRRAHEERAGPAGGESDREHSSSDQDEQETAARKHGDGCGGPAASGETTAASGRGAERTQQSTGEVDSCCPRCRLESSERKRFRALDRDKFKRSKGNRSRQDEMNGRQQQRHRDSAVTKLDLTITSDEPTNEPVSEGEQKCPPIGGESGDMARATNYLSADPTSAYFNKDEYTKRHRQSIAVQTFFTKSIEVNADDDDDDLEVMGLHSREPANNPGFAEDNKQSQKEEERDGAPRYLIDSYNRVAGGTPAAVSNQRTISMDTPVMRDYESFDGCSFNQYLTHDDDDQTMDSTTSGWTAPTSTGLESSGERFGGGGGGGTGSANTWHDTLASSSPTNRPSSLTSELRHSKCFLQQQAGRRTMTAALETLDPAGFGQPTSSGGGPSGLDLESHHRNRSFTISGGDNAPLVVHCPRLACQQQPLLHGRQSQPSSKDRHLSTGTSNELDLVTSDDVLMDRANSGDFSSFTLGNTSTTTSNQTRPEPGCGARNVSLPMQQRSANQIDSITVGQQSHALADQRRAWSETAAGNDDIIGSLLEPGARPRDRAVVLHDPAITRKGQADEWTRPPSTFTDRRLQSPAPEPAAPHVTSSRLARQARPTDPSVHTAGDDQAGLGAGQAQPGSQVMQACSSRANPSILPAGAHHSGDYLRTATTATTTSSSSGQLSRSKLLGDGAGSQAATPATSSSDLVKSAPVGRTEAGASSAARSMANQRQQGGSVSGQHSYQHLDESSNYNQHRSPPGAPPSSQQNQASDPGPAGPAPTPYTNSHVSSAGRVPAHSSHQVAAHSSAVNPPPPTARHAQHHQWRQSNTFSSSLNSDISTSGGPNTKDTTEKDSSRRTSTLSGISSIYQQETSLGLGTPQSSYACGNSTPANTSQGGASNSAGGAGCSNMGSIPELATFEHSINQQHHQQHGVSLGPGNDPGPGGALNPSAVDAGDARAGNLRTSAHGADSHVAGKFNRNRFDSLVEGKSFNRTREPCAQTHRFSAGEFRRNSRDQESLAQTDSGDQSQVDPAGSQQQQRRDAETNDQSGSASAANNIQRVALSLRSQLRERLSGMRPLSGFMNLSFDPSAGSSQAPIQEEEPPPPSPSNRVSPTEAAGRTMASGSGRQLGEPAPLDQRGDSTTPSGGGLQDQKQRQMSFASSSPFNSLTAATTPTYRSGTTSAGQRAADTHTPSSTSSATAFKSFFRSTSSAAFNVFASSFQQQHTSNSSTPTATTVIAAPARSSSSQNNSPALQQRFGSLSSSDVFDPPPPTAMPPASPQMAPRGDLSCDGSQNQLMVNKEPPTGSPRSPLSPISVTSMRFFARIRDKFSLNNNSNQQQAFGQNLDQGARRATEIDAQHQADVDRGANTETSRPEALNYQAAKQPSLNDDSLRSCDLNDIAAQESGPIPFEQPQNPLISRYQQQQQQQQWMDSCQQSMESSSSIRSLRSCWFSMPELFAMNNDGSSLQSPCGSQLIQLAACGQQPPAYQTGHTGATMDELLESLSHKLLVPTAGFDPDHQQQLAVGSAAPDQQLIAGEQSGWASNQLFRQLTSQEAANQNWSINDLDLTSDDIAPAGGRPVHSAQNPQPRADQLEPVQSGQQQPNLVKYSTLDDSICVSMKSTSSATAAAAKPQQVAGAVEDTKRQQAANPPPPMPGHAPADSRPVSQNSTISSTSCALSDLNSSDLQELNRSTSNSNLSPHNISPLNNSPVSGGDASANEFHDEMDALKLRAQTVQLARPAQQKQHRAMSLVCSRLSPVSPETTPDGLGLSPAPRPCSSMLTLPRSTGTTIRRRSAAPGLAPGDDVPPAATTLDLRLGARKSRVRLTDLHPVTFINDMEFLRSMSSLKNAPNNRLDAIFNSAVGRRLSINAEVAAQQQKEQRAQAGGSASKASIKIGLTGYVYIDRPDGRLRPKEFQPSIRRPSLAPNFWRQNHRPSFMDNSGSAPNDLQPVADTGGGGGHLLACGSHTGQSGNLTLPGGAQSRARSASFTPTMTTVSADGGGDPSKSGAQSRDQRESVIDLQKPDAGCGRKTPGAEKDIAAAPSRHPQKPPIIVAKSRSPLAGGSHRRRSMGGAGPLNPYHLDVRRRSMMLERLSESSIEVEAAAGGGGGGGGSGEKPTTEPALVALDTAQGGRKDAPPKSPRLTARPQSSPTARSISPYHSKSPEPSGRQKPLIGPSTSVSSVSESSSDDDDDDGDGTATSSNEPAGRDRHGTGAAARLATSGGQQSDSSSSDDGDIDKLVAQYSVVGDHLSRPPSNAHRRPLGHVQHSHLRDQEQHQHHQRAVKNDKILRQLLMANKAASLTGAGCEGAPAWAGGAPTEVRRFSAINLYQRDEDLFVANSMKRPPSSQIQILHALPQLANTLPVLAEKPIGPNGGGGGGCVNGLNNVHAQKQQPLAHNQLPVLANKRSPVKSIISGTSGLTTVGAPPPYNYGQRSASNEMPLQSPTRAANAISTMDSMASVDVEEQLRRLRQQERRSQAAANAYHQNFNERELEHEHDLAAVLACERKQLSLDDSLTSCDLNDIVVPDAPTVPEILRPPETHISVISTDFATPEPDAPDWVTQQCDASTTTVSREPPSPPEQQRPLTPPGVGQLIIAPNTVVPQIATTLASRLIADSLPAALSFPASQGSKSCEPPFTKPLDTIIEGRGLLLGPEQDRAYANKLRRLSGHSHSNSRRASDVPLVENDWCKCDADQPPVRKLSQVGGGRPPAMRSGATKSDSAANCETNNGHNLRKRESEQTASENESSKSVLNTVRNLARRTLVSFSTFSYSMDFSSDTADGQYCKKQPLNSRGPSTGNIDSPSRENAAADSSTSTSSADSHLDSGNEIGPAGRSSSSSMISLDDAENYRTKNKDNKMEHGRSMESSSSRSSSTLSVDGEDRDLKGGDNNGASQIEVDEVEEADEEEEEEEEEEDDSEDDDDSDTDVDEPKICYKCNKCIKIEADPNDSRRNLRPRSSEFSQDDTTTPNNKLGWRPKASTTPGHLLMHSNGSASSMAANSATQGSHARSTLLETGVRATSTGEHNDNDDEGGKHCPAAATKSAGPGGKHARRRAEAARRSASMNATEHPSTSGQQSGGPVNRRKNKWHIQRNLAPKLKRQRSFSANYAPEVPNPMMPPPRRFSAAPTLTCPHRNKSSSHSSSSLHHAYSIDSSESMITVIPANRGGLDLLQLQKRQSRGSISCLSSQAQSPCNSTTGNQLQLGLAAGQQSSMSISLNLAGHDQSGSSLYGLPRSPLSPRSPSRCSPIALTPNASEPLAGQLGGGGGGVYGPATTYTLSLETPLSPANTSNTTTCSSIVTTTILQQQNQQQTMNWISNSIFDPRQQQQQLQLENQISTNLPHPPSSSFLFDVGGGGLGETTPVTLMSSHKPALPRHTTIGGADNSSTPAENGTSFNSSRNGLDEIGSVSSYGHEPEVDGPNYPQIASTTPSGLLSPRLECSANAGSNRCSSPAVLIGESPAYGPMADRQREFGKHTADTLMPVPPAGSQQSHRGSTIATTYEMNSSIDPNRPIVCETINDFCARHSREELEYLVGQIEGLRISECYYSEKSSTLCMVIEVHHRVDGGSGAGSFV